VEIGNVLWRTLETSDQKKMAEVVTLLATAGNQGHADAQYHLAHLYDRGQGITEDNKEAARWYRKAAEQG
jgi:TPR repeat protein